METNTAAAQRLGSSGGKATASKRTKEERSAAASVAAKKRWDAVRADREPDPFIFEVALIPRYGFWEMPDKRSYHSNHRAKILVDAGFLEYQETRSGDYIFYRPTEKGLQWWFEQRIARYEKSRAGCPQFARDDEFDPAALLQYFEGQGIGNTVEISTYFDGAKVFIALRDGLLGFAGYRDYKGGIGMSEYITVRLTKKGYEFFGSLPRFVEVWA